MIHVFNNPTEQSRAVADLFAQTARTAVQANGQFTVALTGGSSPRQLYQMLAQSPYREQIAWDKMHVFWGDERCVPFDDDRNNAKMAFDALLRHVPVPESQIHRMIGDIPPNESAAQYEEILRQYFTDEGAAFDLILLGMGDDGHTASLFPYTPVVQEISHWAKEVYLPEQDMYRITLTAPFINRSRTIAFLLFGDKKADTLHHVLEGEKQPNKYPSQLIQPVSGEIHWFVDEAAAAKLKRAGKQ